MERCMHRSLNWHCIYVRNEYIHAQCWQHQWRSFGSQPSTPPGFLFMNIKYYTYWTRWCAHSICFNNKKNLKYINQTTESREMGLHRNYGDNLHYRWWQNIGRWYGGGYTLPVGRCNIHKYALHICWMPLLRPTMQCRCCAASWGVRSYIYSASLVSMRVCEHKSCALSDFSQPAVLESMTVTPEPATTLLYNHVQA